MTINSGELIRAVSVVADKHNIRVTVKTSAKYSLIVAGSVFLGGILMVITKTKNKSILTWNCEIWVANVICS